MPATGATLQSIADGLGQASPLAALPAGALASSQIVQIVVVLTALSVAPSLLVMMTSFTRLVIAFSFLRSGLGLQSTPANIVMISLAGFMTWFIMAPAFDAAWRNGVQPLMAQSISEAEAVDRIVEPFRQFMLKHVRDKDLGLLTSLSREQETQTDRDRISLRVLAPAFMMSELRRGFEIGFLIALPFLVIDLIVATLTMSMGMMMLPPSVIALPVKVLFFVLIDGWSLLVGSLIRSYG
jgi:flagellar biosynthesis protein FliP